MTNKKQTEATVRSSLYAIAAFIFLFLFYHFIFNKGITLVEPDVNVLFFEMAFIVLMSAALIPLFMKKFSKETSILLAALLSGFIRIMLISIVIENYLSYDLKLDMPEGYLFIAVPQAILTYVTIWIALKVK
jgi:hypothetical protein